MIKDKASLVIGPFISLLTGVTVSLVTRQFLFLLLAVGGTVATVIPQVSAKRRDQAERRTLEGRINDLRNHTGSADSTDYRDIIPAEDRRLLEFKIKRDEAENALRPYLPANLRGAKRLINHERLYVQIAEDRGIFGGDPELTYRHLAKWVVIVEHWPRLGAALTRGPEKMEILENCTDIENLQTELGFIDPSIQATDEMLNVLSKAVPLWPILDRLVRFEPSAVSTQQTSIYRSETSGETSD